MMTSDAAHVDRLIGVVLAARDAFISASRATTSPILQSLFRERAEDQSRIATELTARR